MGRSARGNFLYWGDEALSEFPIRIRRVRDVLNKFELIGAMVFAIGFLVFFFLNLFLSGNEFAIFSLNYWRIGTNLETKWLWWSLVFWGFLAYKIYSTEKHILNVEFREFGETPAESLEEMSLSDWNVVRHLPRRKRIDISHTFTQEAHRLVDEAYLSAKKSKLREVTTLNFLFAALDNEKISGVFLRLGVSGRAIQAELKKAFEGNDKIEVTPELSEDARQIIFNAYEIAYRDRVEEVDVTEILLAVVAQSEIIQEYFYDLKIDAEKLTNVVEWIRIRKRLEEMYHKSRRAAARRSKYGMDRAMTAVATPFLNSFSQDLTLAAKFGYLNPCVARDREINEIFRVIESGRQSVVLVGERGVGKMSIVEGIAMKMIEDDVPKRMRDKRLVQLSTSALLAGTTVSGAQERLIGIMNEVSRAGNIILFVKNLPDIMGGEVDESQGMDVSKTLAEFMGRGDVVVFATSGVEGYNKHIVNSDIGMALARVNVSEMSENQAIQVLEAKAGYIEYKNKVFFSYDAIASAVKLSAKFMHDQNLPSSALAIGSEAAAHVRQKKGENQLVRAEDVSEVVAEKTGIPSASISQDESSKLMHLEEEMHKRVVGQDEAVDLVANALRRARAEIRSVSRPIANFLFLGPTGVGKTELAKTIADVYFGGEDRMIRIDMSEYQDKSGIYRLIGEPGRQGTGILTEAVRQRPFSLLLLDELEKADTNVLNIFLQVFDDGRLTDSVGRVIDFTNTIIIATSNAATKYVQEKMSAGVPLEEIRQALIRNELQAYYRPEFLNRFDGIVLFKTLNKNEIKSVAANMLKRVAKDLEKRGVFLRIEDSALDALVDVGFDPTFGARPMRRAIQDRIENKLAELVLSNKLERRDTIVIGANLTITVEKS